jgi:diphthine-ammonia ligase
VELVPSIAEAMQVPLVRQELKGKSVSKDLEYTEVVPDDEVEDLYALLQKAKHEHPEVEAVACGAIFSTYQRLRVEHVCQRLNLTSLAYLWMQPQPQLLSEMISTKMDARIVKVCAMGLQPAQLMKSIAQLQVHFTKLEAKFGFNVCGEGGEYESAVLDCPLFRKRVVVDEFTVCDLGNEYSPQAHVVFTKVRVEEKSPEELEEDANLMKNLAEQAISSLCKLPQQIEPYQTPEPKHYGPFDASALQTSMDFDHFWYTVVEG